MRRFRLPIRAPSIAAASRPCSSRPIRSELRLVGNRADDRIVEDELGFPGERDLVDELGCDQVGDRRFDTQCLEQVECRTASRRPLRRSAVRFAFGSRRSMRAAIVACSVAGTLTSVTSAVDRYAPGFPCSTPRSASSRTISSAKNGLPAPFRRSSRPARRLTGPRPTNRRPVRWPPYHEAAQGQWSGHRAPGSTHPDTRAGR